MSEVLTRDPPEGPNLYSLELLEVRDYRRKSFVLHYTLGEDDVRGIAYKSYKAAYGTESTNSAAVGAAALMKDPEVKKAIADVRDTMEMEFKSRMRSWVGMALKAQTILDNYLNTMMNPALAKAMGVETKLTAVQLLGLQMTFDRALGKPVQKRENEIGERLSDVIKRLASQKQPPQLNAGVGERVCVKEILPGD